MANKRIKDLGTTASTLAADDYVAIDGNANGTRKIVKGDLVNDISTQVAGTYLDEANNLSDVASKDTSKLNLEVPDVGTAPNEVPMNGMLGDMAYQSAEAVSMGTVSADELDIAPASGDARIDLISGDNTSSSRVVFGDSDDTNVGEVRYSHSNNSLAFHTGNTGEKVRIDSTGRVAIGTASPSSKLFVNETAGNAYITVTSGDTNQAGVLFGDQTDSVVGGVVYNNNSDQLQLRGSNNQTRCTIDSSGRVGIGNSSPGSYSAAANNLVVGSGSGSEGITIATGAASEGGVFFADGTSGADAYRGAVIYKHSDNSLRFSTNATTRWQISSAGHLISNNGLYGIDFGSTNTRTGVTISGSTLSHYEEGSWTPTIGTVHAGPTPGASAVYSGKYVRIGQLVHCSMDLDFDASGTSVAVDDRFTVGSLPLAVNPSLDTYTGAGSLFIYLSAGAGNNAFGTVGVSTTGDSAICYITHIDGTVNWGNNLRATFTYHTDA